MSSRPRENWREVLLSRHRNEELLADTETSAPAADDPSWDEAANRQKLEFMRQFDPDASLDEELTVRLKGQGADAAALPLDWITLLKPIQACVNDFSNSEIKLELCNFSRGSTVLHVRAVDHAASDSLEDVRIDQTALAGAVEELLRMVRAADSEGDLRAWKTRIDAFERLVQELNDLQLTADFKLVSKSGRVKRAGLSRRGIDYVRGLSETTKKDDFTVISGLITELRASGHAKVKASPQRNSTAWDVSIDPEQLASMKLLLGQKVSWRVREIIAEDKLSRRESLGWEFIEYAHAEHPLVGKWFDGIADGRDSAK